MRARRQRSRGNDPRCRRSARSSSGSARTCRTMTRRAPVDQRRAGAAGQDALLLLRPAVRHPAQGPRQRGDRLRAVGRVPVQPRHAVSEGRQAIPAGIAPRSPADGAAARSVGRGRLQRDAVRRGDREGRVRNIARCKPTHGAGAIGVLGGASLTTEKTYLMGKFARVCLKTPYIDYNGRLCMVSAGAAQQEGVRHRSRRRIRGPTWSGPRSIWVAGSNVAECSPITTNYIWQAREQGAKDHRSGSAHHADRADVRSVPAGQARPRRGALRRRAAI